MASPLTQKLPDAAIPATRLGEPASRFRSPSPERVSLPRRPHWHSRLERRGLIERRLNPRDRGSFTVRLTDRGVAAADRVRRTFADMEARALGAVSQRSAKGFFDVLAALDEMGAG